MYWSIVPNLEKLELSYFFFLICKRSLWEERQIGLMHNWATYKFYEQFIKY